jgi:protein-disulfide isomerase
MKMRRIIFLFCLLLPAVFAADQSCSAAQDADKANLATYVQKKYRLAKVPSVREIAFVEGSCFRRLAFADANFLATGKPFRAELIASPDMRFLARELLDVRVDPAEEIKRQERLSAQRLSSPGVASLGPADAPVTLVLFSDLQCPFCSKMATGLMNDILPAEDGKVRIVFHNFPLSGHKWARQAAEVAACAAVQGDRYFWLLHDYTFSHQREIVPENVIGTYSAQLAAAGNFDPDKFKACVESGDTAASVDRDIALGKQMKITGTPTLFINGKRVNGYRLEEVKALIHESLPPPAAAQ